MKKVVLILSLLVALVVVGSSLGSSHHAKRIAATGYGAAVYSFGGPCSGCGIDIHNSSTGANGFTITDGNGTYVVNMNNLQTYQFRVNTCKVHSRYLSSWSGNYSGGSTGLPTLVANPVGGC